jgi:hypothetical protein
LGTVSDIDQLRCLGAGSVVISRKDEFMSSVVLFDGQSCCGPSTDQGQAAREVARFVADAEWLTARGVDVRRVTISSDPAVFVSTRVVCDLLMAKGMGALPALVVDGDLLLSGRYPTRDELTGWCGLGDAQSQAAATSAGSVSDSRGVAGSQQCCSPASVGVFAPSGGCCAPGDLASVSMTSDGPRS